MNSLISACLVRVFCWIGFSLPCNGCLVRRLDRTAECSSARRGILCAGRQRPCWYGSWDSSIRLCINFFRLYRLVQWNCEQSTPMPSEPEALSMLYEARKDADNLPKWKYMLSRHHHLAFN